jgi:hypothetical protein
MPLLEDRREFLTILAGIGLAPLAGCLSISIKEKENALRDEVQNSFQFKGITLEFKGWDLYIKSDQLAKLRQFSPKQQLVVYSEDQSNPRKNKAFADQKNKIVCSTNLYTSYYADNGDLVIKFIPPDKEGIFKFTLYLEDRRGNQSLAQQFSHSAKVFCYDKETILSEKEINANLENQILAIKKLWSQLGAIPTICLINWNKNITRDFAGLYNGIQSSELSGYKKNILLDLTNFRADLLSQTIFNSCMYHELGHWLFDPLLQEGYVDIINQVYDSIGGISSKKNYLPFSEETYNIGGGHPWDGPTELCASLCAIYRYAADQYIGKLKKMPSENRKIHLKLMQTIFGGIIAISSREIAESIFPKFNELLRAALS